MIPNEVAVIAKVLAEEQKGSEADYKQFIDLAYKIYNRLQQEK